MLKSRLPLVALAGSVGLFLVVGWLSLSTGDFGTIHDDGIYAVTARSLAVTGEYRITSLPGEPYQRKYPIVFPAMLAARLAHRGRLPGEHRLAEGGVASGGSRLSFPHVRAVAHRWRERLDGGGDYRDLRG